MSPSLGPVNQNVLTTSDYCIVPLHPDYFSAMALSSLAQTNAAAGLVERTMAVHESGTSVNYQARFRGASCDEVPRLSHLRSVRFGNRAAAKSHSAQNLACGEAGRSISKHCFETWQALQS